MFLARVYVTLKPAVNDPQGRTILSGLRSLGFDGAADVRAGKYLEIRLDAVALPDAEAMVDEMCSRLLANPGHRELPLRGGGSFPYSLMVPFVLGTSPAARGSTATAVRNALASALKAPLPCDGHCRRPAPARAGSACPPAQTPPGSGAQGRTAGHQWWGRRRRPSPPRRACLPGQGLP